MINRTKVKIISLILIRVLILIYSKSILHPDEHYQSTEIGIQDIFNLKEKSRTWEWIIKDSYQGNNKFEVGIGPYRSIIPVYIFIHFPLFILKSIYRSFQKYQTLPSTFQLIITSRIFLFLLSLFIDYLLLFQTDFNFHAIKSIYLLFSTSPATLVFLTRPLINSFETILFTLVFFLTISIYRHFPLDLNSHRYFIKLSTWTTLINFSIWSRFSFLLFCFPLISLITYKSIIKSRSILSFLTLTFFTLLTIFYSCLIDSNYFNHYPSIPPLNLFLYNLNSDNLSLHGLHSKWLHCFVNGPLLFGPSIWFVTIWGTFNVTQFRNDLHFLLSLSVIVSGLAFLSIQPHQEPRFLLPLLIPICMTTSHTLLTLKPASRKLFWKLHFLHSIFGVVFYGFIHQGGIIPTISHIKEEPHQFRDKNSIITWKTFDFPKTLVLRTPTSDLNLINLRGLDEMSMLEKVCKELHVTRKGILVFPLNAFKTFEVLDLVVWNSFDFHLDMDRINDYFDAKFKGNGICMVKIDRLCHRYLEFGQI
ncbi:Alg9-like mannosyltransferase family-domain-containing protein [Melampsora americana]|nr:Alg9-like mannosyltransferase family-domain-containing protein [Melampsora americana]